MGCLALLLAPPVSSRRARCHSERRSRAAIPWVMRMGVGEKLPVTGNSPKILRNSQIPRNCFWGLGIERIIYPLLGILHIKSAYEAGEGDT